MKVNVKRVTVGDKVISVEDQVRNEIETFLQALDSYPDSVARNPRITFEEHCNRLIRAEKTESTLNS